MRHGQQQTCHNSTSGRKFSSSVILYSQEIIRPSVVLHDLTRWTGFLRFPSNSAEDRSVRRLPLRVETRVVVGHLSRTSTGQLTSTGLCAGLVSSPAELAVNHFGQ
ncbi:hypothetical protein R1flu_020033 [Riccia fluitans]|uniref:Uncharacterized protein n=1 Tax=Riccia fluitans TaxID=41844 RepID=A0ABD1ZLT4_9MARC